MRKRIIVLIIFIATILYSCLCIDYFDLNKAETIQVEVKGYVQNEGIYELNLGANVDDLLKIVKLNVDSDISNLSLQHILKNNEIVTISKKNNSDLISINSSGLYELAVLPGIGKSIALRIIEYREEYGSFLTLEDLMNVSGIGNKKYEKIKQYICL